VIAFLTAAQWFVLLYFLALNAVYLMLVVRAIGVIARYMQSRDVAGLPELLAGFAPPVTLVIPAHDEEAHILQTLRSLEQHYPEYEIVVVNDGSSDRTLEVLTAAYDLRPFPEAYRGRLKTQPVHAIYQSTVDTRLRVVDKERGGRGDAVNAGVNAARYPWICRVDADSILQRDSLRLIVEPLLEDPAVIACGGTIRVANGCKSRDGLFVEADLPTRPLVLFQVIEYLRAFLYGRMGWSPMNAHLIISGAFSIFHKETFVAAGGYRCDTIGEDMELIVRLHRTLSAQRKRYRITFVPEPICWSNVPEKVGTLRRQRIRWQVGLAESLMMNRGLMFHKEGSFAGWFAYPFTAFFELLGPLVETAGYAFVIVGLALGIVSPAVFVTFMLLAVGFGVLLSTCALLLEEISFRLYKKPRHILILFALAVLENFGYRQLTTLWRTAAVVQHLWRTARARLGGRRQQLASR